MSKEPWWEKNFHGRQEDSLEERLRHSATELFNMLGRLRTEEVERSKWTWKMKTHTEEEADMLLNKLTREG